MGANRKAKPRPSNIREEVSRPGDMLAPMASRRSALPQRPMEERLPCLATGTPAAARTNEEVVLILKVRTAAPPVPHRSMTMGWEVASLRHWG
jgi:hypothetical protein